MDNLIEDVEKSAVKYNDSRNNLKERFIDVCNKDNELGRIFTENEIRKFKLVSDIIKSHIEYIDSLPSVKPINK